MNGDDNFSDYNDPKDNDYCMVDNDEDYDMKRVMKVLVMRVMTRA
jgi:hypothetical protein